MNLLDSPLIKANKWSNTLLEPSLILRDLRGLLSGNKLATLLET